MVPAKNPESWRYIKSNWDNHLICLMYTVHWTIKLSLFRLPIARRWWIFNTSAYLLLFVLLFRHLIFWFPMPPPLNTVSILGFENCQSFFSATAHVRCTVPARPTPRGRCRSVYSIFYWQNDTAIVISLQHASNCIKNTILSLFLYKTSRLLQ